MVSSAGPVADGPEPAEAEAAPHVTATRMGVIGVLEDRGVVTAVDAGTMRYRRGSGAERTISVADAGVSVGDLVAIRSATFPDGRIVPVALRLYREGRWTMLCDPADILQPRQRARAPLLAAAALGGGGMVAAGVTAWALFPFCAAGLAAVAWDARRRRADRAAVRTLFERMD